MKTWDDVANIRRNYGHLVLDEATIARSPFIQFEQWLNEIMQTEQHDPTAMVLSSVDEQGSPDSRVVLLKGLLNQAFIFYTNYASNKARQIDKNPQVALNFYWPMLARQVRIRGAVAPVSAEESDAYFSSRPRLSQLSAIVSPQSRKIEGRKYLEDQLHKLVEQQQTTPVRRPHNWGGYAVTPHSFEFWQGRDDRLHDRIHYYLSSQHWHHERLAP